MKDKIFPVSESAHWNTSTNFLWEEKCMNILTQILKNKTQTILWNKKLKNKYDPKVETFKYLVLFHQKIQNKYWLIFNNESKLCKCIGLVYRHWIFNSICSNFRYQQFRHWLHFCYLQFEHNCSPIGEWDTRPLKIVAILFRPTVESNMIITPSAV